MWRREALLVGACFLGSALFFAVAAPIQPDQTVGGQFNSTALSLSDGQKATIQLDNKGWLMVDIASGSSSGGSGTSSTFNAAFPATGTAAGYVSATGTMTTGNIDANGQLKVNCATGCSGGTFNNNADGVATSATNGQAAAWNYGWNGAAWDRLSSGGNNGDAVSVASLGILSTGSFIYGFNGASWDRIKSTGDNADAIGSLGVGDLRVANRNYGFNGTTWDRFRLGGNNADAVTTSAVGILSTGAFNFGWNGATWDRIATGGTGADGQSTVATGNQAVRGFGYGFNGSTWDRLRSGGNNADAVTTSSVGILSTGAFTFGFNGATWDRLQVDANKFLKVNVQTDTALVNGTVTTNQPSYTAGNNSPLSLDASGNLRVTINSPGTLPVSGTVTANAGSGTFAVSIATNSNLDLGTVSVSAPAYTAGNNSALSVDTAGSLRITPGSPLISTTVNSATNGLIAKAAPGVLYNVYATSTSTPQGLLVVLNQTTVPANGAAIVPKDCVPLPSSGNASINYPGPPENFATGIVALISANTSCFTLTLSSTLTGFIHAGVQ